MIYNLVQLIRSTFPAWIVYANTREATAGQEAVPDECILVRETGGNPGVWADLEIPTVQIITRAASTPQARLLSQQIFDLINSKFGLILPAITVDSVVYPAISTSQISAIQQPFCLGKDDQRRTEFTNNYQVYFKA